MTAYGYARVSTDGQSLASQDAQLHAGGCSKVYAEKISGARSDRPELAKVLKRLNTGDVLMVTRLDRLARSTRDLHRQAWRGLQEPGRRMGRHNQRPRPVDGDNSRRSRRVRARANHCPYRRRQSPCEGSWRAFWSSCRSQPPSAPGSHPAARAGRSAGRCSPVLRCQSGDDIAAAGVKKWFTQPPWTR